MWYGRQGGEVYLPDRKVRIERPRLRRKGEGEGGEVEVPAYGAMKRPGPLADRMLEILMAGVSTRKALRKAIDQVFGSARKVTNVLKQRAQLVPDSWQYLVFSHY